MLGGGHSIGIPLAVSARRSSSCPATMTVHPVRHSGLVLGVPQTMRYFEQMQQRITGFSGGPFPYQRARFTELMMHTGELVMDMGSVVDGETAVAEGLIDELGGLGDALHYLYRAIEAPRDGAPGAGKPEKAAPCAARAQCREMMPRPVRACRKGVQACQPQRFQLYKRSVWWYNVQSISVKKCAKAMRAAHEKIHPAGRLGRAGYIRGIGQAMASTNRARKTNTKTNTRGSGQRGGSGVRSRSPI